MRKFAILIVFVLFYFQSSLQAFSSNPKEFVSELVNESISTLSNKQMLLIKDWSNSVIDLSNTQQIDSYHKMVSTLCDTTDKKTITKIKKKISNITGI